MRDVYTQSLVNNTIHLNIKKNQKSDFIWTTTPTARIKISPKYHFLFDQRLIIPTRAWDILVAGASAKTSRKPRLVRLSDYLLGKCFFFSFLFPFGQSDNKTRATNTYATCGLRKTKSAAAYTYLLQLSYMCSYKNEIKNVFEDKKKVNEKTSSEFLNY